MVTSTILLNFRSSTMQSVKTSSKSNSANDVSGRVCDVRAEDVMVTLGAGTV
jgi:hypothetical protein